MLPRDNGGVVDANLLVYGTQNLRVIDASVPPTAFSAHLMSIVYGIGEIGSEIIIAARQAELNAANGNGQANGTGNGTSSNSPQDSNSGARNSASAQMSSPLIISLSLSLVALTAVLAPWTLI